MKIRKAAPDVVKLPPATHPEFVHLKDAAPGRRYLSFTLSAIDGRRMPIERLNEPPTPAGELWANIWYENMQSWSRIKLPPEYKVVPTKEAAMKLGSKKAAVSTNGKTPVVKSVEVPSNSRLAVGKTTKKNVWETWGIAFQKLAAKADASKHIAEFMESEFPGRKTKFAKWVNNVRIRYNNGALGVAKPAVPLKPFVEEKRAGKDRRATAKTKVKRVPVAA